MAAVVLVSAKGSPGVTTTAAALTAVASQTSRTVLAELDPSGGSIQAFTGRAALPGLVEAASQLRRDTGGSTLHAHVTVLPDGVPTLLAPTSGVNADAVIESAEERWVGALRDCAEGVVVDAGRWSPAQRTARRIVGADLVAVVCRPTVADVEASRHLLDRLQDVARRPLALLVVGNRPYVPDEVSSHLDLPLLGTLAWDPQGAVSLWANGGTRRWLRTRLARSATTALAGLAQHVGLGRVVPPGPPRPAPGTPNEPGRHGYPEQNGPPSSAPHEPPGPNERPAHLSPNGRSARRAPHEQGHDT